MDDGDIPCHPGLVVPYPDAFDAANDKVGAKPNRTRTDDLWYATAAKLTAAKDELELLKMRDTAALGDGMLTLGVAKGGRWCACSYLQ